MQVLYKSTRGKGETVTASMAILKGLSEDGGLFVPTEIPKLDVPVEKLAQMTYQETAYEVMSRFLTDFTEDELKNCIANAYDEKFDTKEIAPLHEADGEYFLELFHGATIAFKDMALSMLPRMMTLSLKKKGEEREVMILAATSGDTGKAALEGFKDVEGTCIKVFYPIDGVSAIQQQQMVTTTGKNVEIIGIRGNFDDAQSAVKKAFGSKELKELCDEHHIFLSSANSINIGRLIPQIVYYFYSYLTLVKRNEIKLGETVNFTVPSGNFGNCLAGWIAKNMGLPVNQFIVASNKNNILTDFFTTGTYDARREFYKTNAPAMDILVSSNLERLVWFMVNGDSEKVNKYMEELKETGVYKVDDETLARVQKEFKAGCLGEEDVLKVVHDCWNENKYLLDTHTAVGYGVYEEYVKNTGDTTKTILLSTASPYKFPESVYQALTGEEVDVYTAIEKLHDLTGMEISYPLKGIKDREILHKGVIDRDAILDTIAEKIKEY